MNRQVFYLIVMFLAVSLSSTAQNLYVHFNSGTTNQYPISDVRKITFSGSDMNLVKTDGSVLTWALSDVRKYTYDLNVGVVEKDEILSQDVLVYPNPSNGQFKIDYQVEKTGKLNITLFAMNGTLVEVLVSKEQNKGSYSLNWENNSLQAGTYFIRIQTAKELVVKKLIIVK